MNRTAFQLTIAKRKKFLAPPTVPFEVPSTLLELRPDIASAELLMAEANARIGVATASYFSILNLTASRTNTGNNFKNLFSAPAFVWAFLGYKFLYKSVKL